MHRTVQRHQSAERPILRQISSLMFPKIQRRQVIMNVLHPNCAQPPRWSPPVLWRRFEDGLASICVLIHSCKMRNDSETTGLSDGCKWLLVCNATDVGISDTESCQRMTRILRRHHWSTASIHCISALLIAHHSDQ